VAALVDTAVLQAVQTDLRQIEADVQQVRATLDTVDCQALIAQLGLVRHAIDLANQRLIRAYAGQCLLPERGETRIESLLAILEKFT
jgi:DNA-binding FrmR family transcriptional regulator